jgi:hypothetical protein
LLINKVIEDGLVVDLDLLRQDGRKRSSLGVEELVEFLSVLLLEETTIGPDHAVDEDSLESLLVDLLSSSEVLLEKSLQKIE